MKVMRIIFVVFTLLACLKIDALSKNDWNFVKDIEKYAKYESLDFLYEQLVNSSINEKIAILQRILELKSINNLDAKQDIETVDLLLKNLKYEHTHARTDLLIGHYLKLNGFGNEAIQRYLKALTYYQAIKDNNEIARINLALGENMRAFIEQKDALKYLYIAKNNVINDDKLMSEINDRFAAVFFELIFQENGLVYRDSCLIYGKKAFEYALKCNDTALIISTANILGAYYRVIKDYKMAVYFLQTALYAAEKNHRVADMSLIYSNISRLEEEQGDLLKSRKTAFKAFEYAKRSNIKIYTLMSSQILYQNFYKFKDYKNAFKYLEVFQKYRDMLYSEERNRKLTLMTAKYDLDSKERENYLLKKEQQLQNITISKQKQGLIFLLIIMIVLISSVMITAFYFYRAKRVNKLLHEEHKKVMELEKIKSVYAMAITTNHDLNQPLMVLKGRIELLEMQFMDEENKLKYARYFTKIDEAFNQVLDVLKKYRENHPVRFEEYAENEEMVVFETDDIDT